jgi:hypothetical protein
VVRGEFGRYGTVDDSALPVELGPLGPEMPSGALLDGGADEEPAEVDQDPDYGDADDDRDEARLAPEVGAGLPTADEDPDQYQPDEGQTDVAAVGVERHPERAGWHDTGVGEAPQPELARRLPSDLS